jgi:hypothetical protein
MKCLRYSDFVGMDNYDEIINFLTNDTRAIHLGSGSKRSVFKISPKRVIKVEKEITKSADPHQDRWFGRQNEREVNITNKYGHTGLLANVIWYHPKYIWVISEFASTIKRSIFNCERIEKLVEKSMDDFNIGDICYTDARCFGMIDKRIVIIDYGLSIGEKSKKLYKPPPGWKVLNGLIIPE